MAKLVTPTYNSIKKIIKAGPSVHMISAETTIVFTKACEMFIVDLIMHSWLHTDLKKCHTLQKSDISATVAHTFCFDISLDVVPRVESLNADPANIFLPHPEDAMQYFYLPVMDGSGMYSPQLWPSPWPAVNLW